MKKTMIKDEDIDIEIAMEEEDIEKRKIKMGKTIRLEYDKDSDVEGIEVIKEGDFIKIRLVYYWGETKRIVTLSQEEAQRLIQALQKLLSKKRR